MNSDELKALGRAVKIKHPEYANASDEEVGRAVLKKYPQYGKKDSLPSVPSFSDAEVSAAERETEKLTKYGQYLTSKSTIASQVQAIRNQTQNVNNTQDLSVSSHELAMTQNAVQRQLLQEAAKAGLDVATYTALKAEAERTNIEIAKHQALLEMDQEKRREDLADQIKAALVYAQHEKHQILHIQDEVLKLLERRYTIQSGPEPAELKAAKLEVLDGVIAGFIGQLNGLLQGPSQEDAG
ncbi:MAG TPA: hypothetical protein VFA15_05380 [Nitrososphaera sp.]|nr:hypothetical protein [Nitrososphaera sp.]